MRQRPPRVAYLTPLQPVESGISQYSEDLIPWLASAVRLDVIVDGYMPTHAQLLGAARVRQARKFDPKQYDTTLIHMGNSPAHNYMVTRALAGDYGKSGKSGKNGKSEGHILVLHDVVLHHLMVWRAVLRRGGREAYRREMQSRYGTAADAVAAQVLRGQNPPAMFDYPLNEDLIRAARLVVTHSPSAAGWVERLVPGTETRIVPMGVPPIAPGDRDAARARFGIGPETFVILSLGRVNPFKRMPAIFRALRRLADEHSDVLLLIVGGDSPNYDLSRLARFAGVERYVRRLGYVADAELPDLFAAADVAVNLRYPTAGETSAAVLRLLSAGLPVIVTDTGAFSDFPDDVVLKVLPDAFEGETLVAYFRALATNVSFRHAVGANARRFVMREHSLEQAAQGFLEVIAAVTGKPVSPLVAPRATTGMTGKHHAATAAAMTGEQSLVYTADTSPPDPLLEAEAEALAALGLAEHAPTLHRLATALRDLGVGKTRRR